MMKLVCSAFSLCVMIMLPSSNLIMRSTIPAQQKSSYPKSHMVPKICQILQWQTMNFLNTKLLIKLIWFYDRQNIYFESMIIHLWTLDKDSILIILVFILGINCTILKLQCIKIFSYNWTFFILLSFA